MSEHVQEPEPRQDEAPAPDETSTARGPDDGHRSIPSGRSEYFLGSRSRTGGTER